jgi:hypothetical protein
MNPILKRITDKEPTLKEVQEFVGGNIEVLSLNADKMLIFNEEGKIYELPYNEEATQIAYEHDVLFYGDYISGNALLLEGKAQLS